MAVWSVLSGAIAAHLGFTTTTVPPNLYTPSSYFLHARHNVGVHRVVLQPYGRVQHSPSLSTITYTWLQPIHPSCVVLVWLRELHLVFSLIKGFISNFSY